MTKEKEEELSRLATSKAYDAYPMSKTNMCNNEWNAKRVGYYQGYEQAEKDIIEKACEWLYSRQVIDLEVPNIDKFVEDFRKEMLEE